MKKYALIIGLLIVGTGLLAQKDGFVQGRGARIYYRTFGSGSPILIINGGPGLNSDGFVELAKLLSDHHETIIYDQRGTGKSSMLRIDSSTITMKLMVEDIENLRKALNIEKWVVLGHSFGGMLASYYATIHPERISAMILSSSGGIDLGLTSYVNAKINSNLTIQQLDSVNYWAQQIVRGDTSYAAKWHRASNLANAYVFDKKFAPLIAARLTQSNQEVNGYIWQDLNKIHFNCAAKLATFNRPVLIIQGRQDIVDEKTAEKAHRALKNSTIVLVDHSVHYGWLDNRDKYLSEVENFMRKAGDANAK